MSQKSTMHLENSLGAAPPSVVRKSKNVRDGKMFPLEDDELHCSAEVRLIRRRLKSLAPSISWGDFLEYGAQAIFEGMMTSEPQMPNVSHRCSVLLPRMLLPRKKNASAHPTLIWKISPNRSIDGTYDLLQFDADAIGKHRYPPT